MSRASTHVSKFSGARPSTGVIDVYSIIPILACAYALIVFPLIIVSCSPDDAVCLLAPRPESKIFWPALAAISVALAARNYSRLAFPPHIVCLLAYLTFAGASVLWAFKPDISFVRFAQQAMIIISIVVPGMLATRRTDLIRGLFLCFAAAAILNLLFVFGRPPIDFKHATWGYPGYFAGKNYLGECATAALLLAAYEMSHPGKRRAFGMIVAAVAVSLLFFSNSKTSMGLAILAPLLAGTALLIRKKSRLSLAVILLSIPIGFLAFSIVSGVSINRLSFAVYGDSTFTGRTIIWDFVQSEIARRPLFGWGYQSFWLAGPDAPSVLDAPGWVKGMPNAHNGYLDTTVELGYAGYALLLAFIIATIHAVGRVADRDLPRAWLVLSLALHVIITNGLETLWMRGFEMMWVMFVILVAEIGRFWKAPAVAAPRRVDPGRQGPGVQRRRNQGPGGALRPLRPTRRPSTTAARAQGELPGDSTPLLVPEAVSARDGASHEDVAVPPN
jgi:exopolysaccharide production protein ExoQ